MSELKPRPDDDASAKPSGRQPESATQYELDLGLTDHASERAKAAGFAVESQPTGAKQLDRRDLEAHLVEPASEVARNGRMAAGPPGGQLGAQDTDQLADFVEPVVEQALGVPASAEVFQDALFDVGDDIVSPEAADSTPRETGKWDKWIRAAEAEERRIFESLPAEDRAVLEASTIEARRVAQAALKDLRGVADSLNGPSDGDRLEIVAEETSVKEVTSLARKFAAGREGDSSEPTAYLETVKDRARCSIEVPERGYGQKVQDVLSALRGDPYQYRIQPEQDVQNNWQPGNRHYGINVTARRPDGFLLEIQFPTPALRDLGKETHDLYKIVRLPSMPGPVRVEAHLEILRRNKESGIEERFPDGRDRLPAPRDASFVEWVSRNQAAWRDYTAELAARGTSFAEELAQHGLRPEDLPGRERLGL